MFERRVQHLEEERVRLELLRSKEDRSLSRVVVKRIAILEEIWARLNTQGDPYDQLSNVESLLDAYGRRRLRFTGLVTYWSHGKQLCQPRPFDWNEFEAINDHFNGGKWVWVEGLNGPSPEYSYYRLIIQPSTYHQFLHTYDVAYRLRGAEYWHLFEVLYDTGATMARIFCEDLRILQNDTPTINVPILGSVLAADLSAFSGEPVIELEVCLVNHNDIQIRETLWVRIQCVVFPGACPTDRPARLDGPWLRQVMFTATQPDGLNRIFVGSKRGELPSGRFGMPPSLQRRISRTNLGRRTDGPQNFNLPPTAAMRIENVNQRASKAMPRASRTGLGGEGEIFIANRPLDKQATPAASTSP